MPSETFDLVILGGGTAGLTAVMEALEHNVSRIALIERRHTLGGECALNACVPTKTLLAGARHYQHALKLLPQYGIQTADAPFEFTALTAKVTAIIQDGQTTFADEPRVSVIQGDARFLSPTELAVGERRIEAPKIIIATGSEPIIPDIPGLKETGYLLFHQASHLSALPKSMIIIGGGVVGVEYAQMLQSLGCHITLIHKGDRLIDSEEPEISEAVTAHFKNSGIIIQTDCDFKQISAVSGRKAVTVVCH